MSKEWKKMKNGGVGSRDKTFLKITGIIAAFAILVLVIIIPVYYMVIEPETAPVIEAETSTPTPPPTTSLTQTTSPVMGDDNRFDCLPEQEVTQEKCEQRGCTWGPSDTDIRAPSCFFAGPHLYALRETTIAPDSLTSRLRRLDATALNHYGENYAELSAQTTYISPTTLRIKIFPDEQRYEVPMEHPPAIKRPKNALYKAEHLGDIESFAVSVTRRSTSRVIFDTSVGELIFSPQFLQISTKVASEYIYGFGEQMHNSFKHDVDWRTYGMFSIGSRAGVGGNLNGVHPYFLCIEGDGNAYGIFLVNSNAMDVTLQPTPAVTFRSIGGVIDFYVFLGPTPEQVTQQYLSVVGRPFLPPYWSLGFQLSRFGYGNLDNLTNVVSRNVEAGIPYDVQYSDIDYMERQLDFTIDPVNYGGLEDYVRDLKQTHNMRYVIIINPAISGNESEAYTPFNTAESMNVFIKSPDGNIAWGKVWPELPGITVDLSQDMDYQTEHYRAFCAFPDYFHPNASKWWSELIVGFSRRIEFDGLWIDMNEPVSFVDGSPNGCPDNAYDKPPYTPGIATANIQDATICMQNCQYDTKTTGCTEHYNVHSLYGWSQARTTLDSCREATGERCMVISSSTYPGSGKYTGHWTGDNVSQWSHLAASITGVLEFNLFGIPYVGANVCGFFGNATTELCLRWMQLGAFYPFYRNHNFKDSLEQDPAHFGEEFIDAVKPAMQLRYSLLPYLYTLFYDAHVFGSTVVRPFMNEFPDDNITYGIDKQFLWGPSLLITPVLEEGQDRVTGYFPQARWFDYYSGNELANARYLTLDAPLNHINVHVRGGAVIPIQEPGRTTYESRKNSFGLIVALDENQEASGKLFWDDGASIETLENMKYNIIEFSCVANLLRSKVVHSTSTLGNMTLARVRVFGILDTVTRVTVDGVTFAFLYDGSTKQLILDNLNLELTEQFEMRWEIGDEWQRIDCMPSLVKRPDRVSCRQLGCEWDASRASSEAPSCFYPFVGEAKQEVPSYKAELTTSSTERKSFVLTRNAALQRYGIPADKLSLEIEYQTNSRMHFKITDPTRPLYEIPKEIIELPTEVLSNERDALYDVLIVEEPFSLKVKRKSTNNTIFDTSVGPLLFEEKFLQISTILPSEYVFGFGEHSHRRYRHDLNWKRWGIFSRDVPPVGDWNFYGHQTFYMAVDDVKNGSAIGVYFHNSNAMDVSLQPTPALTYRTTGGILDFYLFIGDTQEKVVQQYHQLIGLPAMPPYWALGFHLSRWGYGSLDTVRSVVTEMRQAEIPFDVQYGDIDYMEDKKDFTYDRVNFAGLPEFIDELHDLGMKYIIILDPAIKIEDGYGPYEDGVTNNVFIMNGNGTSPVISRVWPGDTHHADFTHPNTSIWWTDHCVDFYSNEGIEYDALWVDMNEPSSFQSFLPGDIGNVGCADEYNKPPFMPRILWFRTGLHDRTLCMESRQHLGRHYDLHSLYGHTMSRVTSDVLEVIKAEKRSFVLTRSSFAGTGKYAGHWLGDNQSTWSAMAWSIVGMIEFNLFGIPYVGADICGFMLDASAELCERWMQIGAFYPFSRNHNAEGRSPQHPTAFGPAVTASSKKVLEIRYSILPYMYTLFHKVHQHGGTVVRALVHEFPSDKNARDVDSQFLLGSGFLVTPILEEGATRVRGYFPREARWFDFHTGDELQRVGDFVSLSAPLDHINLHVRGGTVIPMQAPATTTVQARKNPFSVFVALDSFGYAFGELYWDDGEARDVGDKFIAIHFECKNKKLNFATHHAPIGFDVSDLYFEKITLVGIGSRRVTSVTLHDVEAGVAGPISFSNDNRQLRISGLHLVLNHEYTISWS